MLKSAVKLVLKFVPANTIAAIIADYVTKALQKISDKEKLAKISDAVGATGNAVRITAEAVHDCEITEAEVDQVSDAIQVAVVKIIEAAK